MECGYKVKINGKEKFLKDSPEDQQFFDSEQMLDAWVAENYFRNPKNLERLRKYTKGKNFLFDSADEASKQSTALENIDRMKKALSERTDIKHSTSGSKLEYDYDENLDVWTLKAESSTYYERLASVTNFANLVDPRDTRKGGVPASNQDEYIERLKAEVANQMSREFPEFLFHYGSGDEALSLWEKKVKDRQDEIVKKYKQKRLLSQLIGEDVHHMMEVHALEKMGESRSFKPGYVLTVADQEATKDSTKKIFDDLCKRYNFSENAVFLPEFEIFGEKLDNPSKRALEDKLGKKIDGLFGRIDLLVIDKGKAYVFDFKTTAEKEVGTWEIESVTNKEAKANGWWVSTKKLEALRQVSLYLAVLESWGLEVGAGEIIPINVEYKEYDKDGYPAGLTIEEEKTEDGRTIKRAPAAEGIRNVKGFTLDRSTEKWPETEPSKRSSAHRIRTTYLPWARRATGLIPPLEIKELVDITKDEEFLFPTRAGNSGRAFEVTVNYYLGLNEDGKKIGESRILPLASDDKNRANGFLYKMYISPKVNMFDTLRSLGRADLISKHGISTSTINNAIYFKTNEDSEIREIIEIYCKELNRVLKSQFNDFAVNLANAMQVDGGNTSTVLDAITQLIGSDPRKQEYFMDVLKRYTNGNWNLYGANDRDNALIQSGVFIFYNDKAIEIVMLSHDQLRFEVNFGTKRRPLKSITNGLISKPEDNWNVLSSSRGNMLLIKAMNIISKDPSIYKNGELKIRNIMAVNPWHMQTVWTDNDFLLSNWNRLCSLSNGRLSALPKNAFYTSEQAAIQTAQDILMRTSIYSYISGMFDNQLKTEKDVMNLIKNIKSKSAKSFNSDGTPKVDTEVGYAVYCLLNALILHRQLRIPMEHDTGKILEGGAIPTGTYASNALNASKITARALDALTAQFDEVYHQLYNERIDAINKELRKIYKACNYDPNLTSRKQFWSRFFEKNANGSVSSQMRIINFSDSFWNKFPPEVKNSFKIILDTLAVYKRISPTPESPTYEMADPNKYYEMPLTKGTFIDSVKKGAANEGAKGVWNVVKDRLQNFKNTAENLYFGDEEIYMKDGKLSDTKTDLNEDLLKALTNSYCQYEEVDRERWCSNNTISYSTDLETILQTAVTAQAISEASQTYGYLYAAVKTTLAVNEMLGGEKTPELSEFVADYITKIYKDESIMNGSNKFLASVIGAVKGATSKLALGFNTRAFTREMIVSAYTGFLRAGNSKIEGIEASDLAFGILYAMKTAPANINKQELVGQLNRRYRMAGQGRSDLPKTNFISDFALRTVDMDNLAYMGTTIPDNIYRVGLLIAKMHADGCFESYELDENGVLKYDAHKDGRFKKYLTDGPAPVFKEYDPSMGSSAAYLKAKATWNSYLNEWKIVYPEKEIISLPDAYPPSIIRAIEGRAEGLWGYFDDSHKSLMCYQFIGSAIMQYKTWLSTKIEQWIKKPGFTNIWKQVQKTDLDGNPLWILTHTPEEIADGKPPLEFITEAEITEDMVKNGLVTPYIVEEGVYSEGMLQSTVAFSSALLRMDFGEFLDMWNDPVQRGNFICGFVDMFGMMLFAGLINLLFGDDVVNNKNAQNWVTQWTYGVLMGVAEDGPIHQVLGSMVGDWNPPSLITLQRLAKTTQSVLAGNKTVPQGFIESFGATKEFSGFFRG